MFSRKKPSESFIRDRLESARDLPFNYAAPFYTQFGSKQVQKPAGYVLDCTRTQIGKGAEAFAAARTAMQQWQHFDLGWVSIANPDAKITPGQIVAVEAHTLGLWSLNFSRILYVIDEEHRFGYAYGTTSLHVESGEERFLIELNPATGEVFYDLLAVSRPAHWLARLGYPYTRSQQRHFARDSHKKLAELIAASL